MKSNITLALLFAVCLTVGCIGQSNKPLGKQAENKSASLDAGYVADNVYTNESLGLRLKFQKSMVVNSQSEIEDLKQEGEELLRPGSSKDARTFDENIQQERIVFSLSTPESETSVGSALNLSIKKDPGGDLGQMLSRSVKVWTESRKSRIENPVTSMLLGEISFLRFVLSTEFEGGRVFTKIFTARRNGHLMTFSLSYAVERESLELEEVLNQVEFF